MAVELKKYFSSKRRNMQYVCYYDTSMLPLSSFNNNVNDVNVPRMENL